MDRKISFSLNPRSIEAIIIVIDEYKAMCDVLRAALEEEGAYRVYPFYRVEESFHLVGQIIPDLFIINYELSQMTGLELYNRLQARSSAHRIPCILLNAPDSSIERDYLWALKKPFGLDALLGRVREALSFASA